MEKDCDLFSRGGWGLLIGNRGYAAPETCGGQSPHLFEWFSGHPGQLSHCKNLARLGALGSRFQAHDIRMLTTGGCRRAGAAAASSGNLHIS